MIEAHFISFVLYVFICEAKVEDETSDLYFLLLDCLLKLLLHHSLFDLFYIRCFAGKSGVGCPVIVIHAINSLFQEPLYYLFFEKGH